MDKNDFIITLDDIICADKYLNHFPHHYYKTDVFHTNSKIEWRNKIIEKPKQYRLKLIISGHSDYSINDKHVVLYNPCIWFTINKQTLNPNANVIALPLGITNYTNESYLHTIYGNPDCIIQVRNEDISYKNLVYMNFNIGTYPRERQHVYDLFCNKEWVSIGNIVNTLEGRKQFLREIKAHTFALCPRGNGVDTHRLWETLYMGSIPIVRHDVAINEFNDLPICFVNNWHEVTVEFLEKERVRIKNATHCMDKLKIGYWINKINEQLKNHHS
jgi:hypothetical protein